MRGTIVGLMGVGLLAAIAAVGTRAQESKTTPAPTAGGTRVAAGDYVEIDPEGRADWNFTITVEEVTPNIVHFRGKNGWVAFASFDAAKNEYRGFFEFPRVGGRGPGGKWADLYQVRAVVLDGVLRIEGKSAENEMLIRARPNGDVPMPAEAKRP
jgi:hypothetical protein